MPVYKESPNPTFLQLENRDPRRANRLRSELWNAREELANEQNRRRTAERKLSEVEQEVSVLRSEHEAQRSGSAPDRNLNVASFRVGWPQIDGALVMVEIDTFEDEPLYLYLESAQAIELGRRLGRA